MLHVRITGVAAVFPVVQSENCTIDLSSQKSPSTQAYCEVQILVDLTRQWVYIVTLYGLPWFHQDSGWRKSAESPQRRSEAKRLVRQSVIQSIGPQLRIHVRSVLCKMVRCYTHFSDDEKCYFCRTFVNHAHVLNLLYYRLAQPNNRKVTIFRCFSSFNLRLE